MWEVIPPDGLTIQQAKDKVVKLEGQVRALEAFADEEAMVRKRKELQEVLVEFEKSRVPQLGVDSDEEPEEEDYDAVVAGDRSWASSDLPPDIKVGRSRDRQGRLESFQDKLSGAAAEARKLAAELLEMATFLNDRHEDLVWSVKQEIQDREVWGEEVAQQEHAYRSGD